MTGEPAVEEPAVAVEGPVIEGPAVEGPAVERLCRQVGRLTAELPGPLRRVRVRSGDATVEIEWQFPAQPAPGALDPATTSPTTGTAIVGAGNAAAGNAAAGNADAAPGTAAQDADAVPTRTVVSPIVGTFYRAAEPGASPFVDVGDVIEAGQVIGIVEAMKLMNQITAERNGRVVEVLVGDGEPVEFEQPLIALVDAGQGRTVRDVREGTDRQPG